MSAQGQGLDIDDDDDTIPPTATAVSGSGGSGGSVNPNDHWHEELPCDCSLSTMVYVLLNQVMKSLSALLQHPEGVTKMLRVAPTNNINTTGGSPEEKNGTTTRTVGGGGTGGGGRGGDGGMDDTEGASTWTVGGGSLWGVEYSTSELLKDFSYWLDIVVYLRDNGGSKPAPLLSPPQASASASALPSSSSNVHRTVAQWSYILPPHAVSMGTPLLENILSWDSHTDSTSLSPAPFFCPYYLLFF